MRSLRVLSCLVGLAPGAVHAGATNSPAAVPGLLAPGTNTTWRLEAADQGEFEFNPETGEASAANGVVVRHGGSILTARRLQLNQDASEVVAEGDVTVRQGGALWTSERVRYEFESGKIETTAFRAGLAPYFISGEGITSAPLATNQAASVSNRVYSITNGVVTTDDLAQPQHRIRARVLTVVPGKYIEGTDAVAYIGETPVFYYPTLRRSLGRHPNNWEFKPGYRSQYGAYLLTTYNWWGNSDLKGSVNLDAYSKRGVGGGPDFFWTPAGWGEGKARGYYIYDNDPGQDAYGQNISHNRGRFLLSHHAAFATNLTATAMLRYQSDQYVVRDFFESEYDDNNQPSTYLEANYDRPNWNLNFLSQVQVNSFQDTVERLPELRLTGLRQRLGESPFYYESENSAGYYEHAYPDIDTNSLYSLSTSNYNGGRLDSYHKIVAPFTFFGWLNFNPRGGARYTGYTEADGPGATTGGENRFVVDTGAELSTRASRVFRGARSRWLDVNDLRHIVEPSLNYTFIPDPNVDARDLPQYDYQVPDFHLQPLEYPNFNSLDAISRQNTLRLGLNNRLQTRREEGTDNLMNWRLFTDLHVERFTGTELAPVYYQGQFLTQPDQKRFSDLYSDLDFKPRDWITLNSHLRYDAGDLAFNEINNGVTFTPGSDWSFTVGQRWRNDTGLLELNNNLIFGSAYIKFNENYAFRISEFFDANAGVLQRQSYTLYRDFRSWTAGLSVRMRKNNNGQDDDFGVALTFSMKAFPRYGLGDDANKPALLLGH